MAEWQKEWQNGRMAGMEADSTASTYVPLYVACRKTNPSLSRLERLVGQKKLDGESFYVLTACKRVPEVFPPRESTEEKRNEVNKI